MTTYTCHDCRTTIPAGAAVLRSTDIFAAQPTAWHRDCWDLRHAVVEALLPAMVPAQRVGGSLSERIAAARVAS